MEHLGGNRTWEAEGMICFKEHHMLFQLGPAKMFANPRFAEAALHVLQDLPGPSLRRRVSMGRGTFDPKLL